MRFVEARLEGFRRFATLELRLGPGVQLLVGRNGAGKTTVLEALRFAAFGLRPDRGSGDAASAVRTGERSLAVEALLEQGTRRLRVRRTLAAGAASAELHDAAPGTKPIRLADGVEAVDRALAAIFGLGSPDRLARVAERLLGDAESDLAAPFLLAEAERRAFFEPLLNLDGYTAFAESVRGLAGAADAERQRLEVESQGSQGDIRSFLEMSERLVTAGREAESAEDQARAAENELELRTEEAHELEARRSEHVLAEREHAVATEARRSRAAEAERARAQLAEAEQAATLVQKAIAAHARWESLESECRALELRLAEREELRADATRLEARLAEGHAAIAAERDGFSERLLENQGRAEAILAQRDGLRAELETLRSRSRRAEGARNALAMAAERVRLLVDRVAAIPVPQEPRGSDEEAVKREAEARHAAELAAAAAEEATAAELAALRARARTADDAQGRLSEATAAADRLERVLVEARRTLEQLRPAMGACPFLQAPCQNLGGQSLVEHFQHEVEVAEAKQVSARELVRFAESRLGEARAAARQLEQRIASRETSRPGADATRRPDPERPQPRTRPSSRARLPFDEIGHHLFALAGVLAAVDVSGDAEPETRALIGSVAGQGEAGEVPRRQRPFDPPDIAAVEAAQRLAHDGKSALDSAPSPGRDERVAEVAGHLARDVRRIAAEVERAAAQASHAIVDATRRSRAAEEALLDSSRELEALAVERARVRASAKELSSKELKLLDIEIALSDRRLRLGAYERIEREITAKRREQASIQAAHDTVRSHQLLADRLENWRDEWKSADRGRLEADARMARAEAELAHARSAYDESRLAVVSAERDRIHAGLGELKARATARREECAFLSARITEMGDVRARIEALEAARRRAEFASATTARLARAFTAIAVPVGEAVRRQVALEASRLWHRMHPGAGRLELGDGFALAVVAPEGRRAFADLSRGEQAGAALAMRFALARQFPGLGILILDEPAASLDSGRRPALARALHQAWTGARGAAEQVVVASHDEALAPAADSVIRLG